MVARPGPGYSEGRHPPEVLVRRNVSTVVTVVGILLVLVHVFLIGWASVGFLEWFLPSVPWTRVSNPDLPRWMQLVQWCLILLAGVVFVAGYGARWRHTPVAMAVIYAAMAAVCAVQTFTYLTSPTRYRAMAIEYAEYTVILAILFATRFLGRA
jgi:hypothetical protein